MLEALGLWGIWAVGSVLLWAATKKLANPRKFQSTLEAAGWPRIGSKLLVWVVPLTEFMVVVVLVLPTERALGGAAAATLFVAFAAYEAWLLRTRPDSACGCFANDDRPDPKRIALSLVLALSSIGIAVSSSTADAWFAGSGILTVTIALELSTAWWAAIQRAKKATEDPTVGRT